MIPRRYVWLLRDEGTCFEQVSPFGGTCKVCSALERFSTDPDLYRVLRCDQRHHLAAHRAEKITNDVDPEAATIAAATERT